jgi:hypothetical protein
VRATLLALLAAMFSVNSASAHALGAECNLRDGRLELEAYFDDDTAARDASVRLLDAGENVVAEGRTDDEGRWSYPAPAPGRYRVVVDAGAGHRTQLRLTIPKADPPAESAISEGPSRWILRETGMAAPVNFSRWLATPAQSESLYAPGARSPPPASLCPAGDSAAVFSEVCVPPRFEGLAYQKPRKAPTMIPNATTSQNTVPPG